MTAAPLTLRAILDTVMILAERPPHPDFIIMAPAQYDYYCFLLALSANPQHPFIVFLRRAVGRARGRACFSALLRYAHDATGFTDPLETLTYA